LPLIYFHSLFRGADGNILLAQAIVALACLQRQGKDKRVAKSAAEIFSLR
jgi:hypothetical protein